MTILNELEDRYSKLSEVEKIDFLTLYIDSRGPAIRKHYNNRFVNEIRNQVQQTLYQVNLSTDLSQLEWTSVFKLAYVLTRGRTNVTDIFSEAIVDYVDTNVEKIPAK